MAGTTMVCDNRLNIVFCFILMVVVVKGFQLDLSTCPGVRIVTRSEWGALPAKSQMPIHTPVPELFIHHTDSQACDNITSCSSTVRGIQKFHMRDRHWVDIGYNYLVGGDGNVYEGRSWRFVGAHTKGYNSKSFGIAMIGTFMNHLPNDKALSAAKKLIACGVGLGKIGTTYRLYGHRDAGTTSCPGDALYAEIQKWPHYSRVPPKK